MGGWGRRGRVGGGEVGGGFWGGQAEEGIRERSV